MHLTPLEVAERIFGGIEQVALVCGLDAKSAYRWRHATTDRGAGDLPSLRHVRTLVDLARARGVDLADADLVRGMPAEALEHLLVPRTVAAQ